MNYVTTNIRIPEEDYLRLKAEAAKSRKSFAAIVREKIEVKKQKEESPEEILRQTRILAKKNAKVLKGWDSLKALREIRDNSKW